MTLTGRSRCAGRRRGTPTSWSCSSSIELGTRDRGTRPRPAAAGVERAAGRRVGGIGHLAGERVHLAASPRPRGRRSAPPAAAPACTGGAGRSETASHGPSSTTRPRYMTAMRSEMWRTIAEVVGDEHVGHVELVTQARQQVHDPGLHRDVERRQRLVEHDDVGFDREGAGDADPLALPAGQLVRVAVGEAPARMPTISSSSPTRRVARIACAAAGARASTSSSARPTVSRGLSEAYGSWNTIWTRRRIGRRSRPRSRRDVAARRARCDPTSALRGGPAAGRASTCRSPIRRRCRASRRGRATSDTPATAGSVWRVPRTG